MRHLAEHFRELYRNRALVGGLVYREVLARYKRSTLGFLWTLLNPLLGLLVYWFLFTRVLHSSALPGYPIYLFAGLLPWTWLSSSLLGGATSIIGGGALITKICLPPQILPAVLVLESMVNFLFALPVLLIAALVGGITPGPSLLVLPVLVGLELVFAYALALFVASLSCRFRDVPFILQNTVFLWFVLTPILYPIATVPEHLRPLYTINPATSLIVPFIDVVYHGRMPSPSMLATAAAWGVVMILVGVATFEAMRDGFAQEI